MKKDSKYTPNWDKLTAEQLDVVKDKGTEYPFTGKFLDHNEEGAYTCIVCKQPLFSSKHKFKSHSGWPSFTEVIQHGNVDFKMDTSHGMIRTEVVCANCGAHLGHVFPNSYDHSDGQTFCINSAALDFTKEKE